MPSGGLRSKEGWGGEVKWGEKGKWKVQEMCLNAGECEKATRKTYFLLPLRCTLPIVYLPLDHQTPNLQHNLSRDYISALLKRHWFGLRKNTQLI